MLLAVYAADPHLPVHVPKPNGARLTSGNIKLLLLRPYEPGFPLFYMSPVRLITALPASASARPCSAHLEGGASIRKRRRPSAGSWMPRAERELPGRVDEVGKTSGFREAELRNWAHLFGLTRREWKADTPSIALSNQPGNTKLSGSNQSAGGRNKRQETEEESGALC